MSGLNVVDSSGWIEYLAGTDRADLFAPAIDDTPNLLVPVITIYEVFKKFHRERGEQVAFDALSVMLSGRVIDIDVSLTLEAAVLVLPLADSLIYAAAVRHAATLWTQDEHFKDLPQVRYFPKPLSVSVTGNA